MPGERVEVERRHGKLAKSGSGAEARWRSSRNRLRGLDDDELKAVIVDEISHTPQTGKRAGLSEGHLGPRIMQRLWADGFEEERIRRLCLELEHDGIVRLASPLAQHTWVVGNTREKA